MGDVKLPLPPKGNFINVPTLDDTGTWDFHHIRPQVEYNVFDRVCVEYHGALKWFKGVITEVEGEGSQRRYTVYTDNGLVDKDVIGAYVVLINKARVMDSTGLIGETPG